MSPYADSSIKLIPLHLLSLPQEQLDPTYEAQQQIMDSPVLLPRQRCVCTHVIVHCWLPHGILVLIQLLTLERGEEVNAGECKCYHQVRASLSSCSGPWPFQPGPLPLTHVLDEGGMVTFATFSRVRAVCVLLHKTQIARP